MGSQFSATSSFSGRVIVWWEESYYYDRGIRNIMAGSHYTLKNNDRGVFFNRGDFTSLHQPYEYAEFKVTCNWLNRLLCKILYKQLKPKFRNWFEQQSCVNSQSRLVATPYVGKPD